MTKKDILIIIGGIAAVLIVVFIFGFFKPHGTTPAHLEVWGVYDEPDYFSDLINEYHKQNKNITIEYKKKTFADYENELINSFAADRGPDIWMIQNTWLPKHKDKIKELPETLLPFNTYRQTFVDVVAQDLTEEGKIYGVPLYVDTLALFYNVNLLNSAGITSPPETWEDLIDDLDKLTKKNQSSGIEKAGISLGTSENINRATDILSLLMLQNGTKMVSDSKTTATLDESIILNGETYYPGKDALRFYAEFANPTKRNYTWNRQMPYSIDAFAEGKTAMMINYAYQIPTITKKAPYLNFRIAPVPQIKGREFDVNYASYWAFTVSKKTKASDEAWKFILYLSQKENNKKYLQKANEPAARRDLIDWQKGDNLNLAVFANQSLTARSWYQIDPIAIEKILSDAIESIVLGSENLDKAIETANNQINLLMKK